MKTRGISSTLLLVFAAAGCASASRQGVGSPLVSRNPAVAARMVHDADVEFMSGMIPHHAQAVKIARWAATHGAGGPVARLCERIVVAQADEIALMQTWLRDRRRPFPTDTATMHVMQMGGMTHRMLMPGMLTDEELRQLDAARSTEFDRLFLTFMIRHHDGAIQMVDKLFGTAGAGQDETVFRFASDVYADQTTEIAVMTRMLASLPSGAR